MPRTNRIFKKPSNARKSNGRWLVYRQIAHKKLMKQNLNSSLPTNSLEDLPKECWVPNCQSAEPVKLMILFPFGKRRKEWCDAIGIPPEEGIKFICEDHFDLQSDAENWQGFKTKSKLLALKKQVVPHIFSDVSPTLSQFPESERKLKEENLKKLAEIAEKKRLLGEICAKSEVLNFSREKDIATSSSSGSLLSSSSARKLKDLQAQIIDLEEVDDHEVVVREVAEEDEVTKLESTAEKANNSVSDFCEVEIKQELVEDAIDSAEPSGPRITRVHQLEALPRTRGRKRGRVEVDKVVSSQDEAPSTTKQLTTKVAQLKKELTLKKQQCSGQQRRYKREQLKHKREKLQYESEKRRVELENRRLELQKRRLELENRQQEKAILTERLQKQRIELENRQQEKAILTERLAHETDLKKTVLNYEKELNKIKIQAEKEKAKFDLDYYKLKKELKLEKMALSLVKEEPDSS